MASQSLLASQSRRRMGLCCPAGREPGAATYSRSDSHCPACQSPGQSQSFRWGLELLGTRSGKHPELSTQIAKLLKRQQGKCSHCRLYFKSDDLLEVHHVDGKHQNHQWGNLTLLHQHCHDQVHSGMHDKHPVVEEPDEAKVSRPVLQTSRAGDHPA